MRSFATKLRTMCALHAQLLYSFQENVCAVCLAWLLCLDQCLTALLGLDTLTLLVIILGQSAITSVISTMMTTIVSPMDALVNPMDAVLCWSPCSLTSCAILLAIMLKTIINTAYPGILCSCIHCHAPKYHAGWCVAYVVMMLGTASWPYSVQESALPLDATCNPVHAWRFNHANTVFQVRPEFWDFWAICSPAERNGSNAKRASSWQLPCSQVTLPIALSVLASRDFWDFWAFPVPFLGYDTSHSCCAPPLCHVCRLQVSLSSATNHASRPLSVMQLKAPALSLVVLLSYPIVLNFPNAMLCMKSGSMERTIIGVIVSRMRSGDSDKQCLWSIVCMSASLYAGHALKIPCSCWSCWRQFHEPVWPFTLQLIRKVVRLKDSQTHIHLFLLIGIAKFVCWPPLQVATAAGKRTAWIDKGPYYEIVQVSPNCTTVTVLLVKWVHVFQVCMLLAESRQTPMSWQNFPLWLVIAPICPFLLLFSSLTCHVLQGQQGNGVMDLYTPEIACQCGDNQTGIPSTTITNGTGIDLAKNVTAARAYDELHVQAVINQINAMQMPNLFGLNFQAVSVGQKVGNISALPPSWFASFILSKHMLHSLNRPGWVRNGATKCLKPHSCFLVQLCHKSFNTATSWNLTPKYPLWEVVKVCTECPSRSLTQVSACKWAFCTWHKLP